MPTVTKVVRHTWDEWFAKKEFTLKRKRDFDGMAHGMAQQVRTAASSKGFSVSVKVVDENTVAVQVKGKLPKRKGK